jgi:hypothetical protein
MDLAIKTYGEVPAKLRAVLTLLHTSAALLTVRTPVGFQSRSGYDGKKKKTLKVGEESNKQICKEEQQEEDRNV